MISHVVKEHSIEKVEAVESHDYLHPELTWHGIRKKAVKHFSLIYLGIFKTLNCCNFFHVTAESGQESELRRGFHFPIV